LNSVASEMKNAAWNTLKKQVLSLMARKYPQYRKYANDVVTWVVGSHAGDLNIHEQTMPEKVLLPIIRSTLYELWINDYRGEVKKAIRAERFLYPDDAFDSIWYHYILDLGEDALDEMTDAELKRLIKVQHEWEAERQTSGAPVTFASVLAKNNPKPMDIRKASGPEGVRRIYSIVANGTGLSGVQAQFMLAFEQNGLADALFMLSQATADGSFDRTAYGDLVGVLEAARR